MGLAQSLMESSKKKTEMLISENFKMRTELQRKNVKLLDFGFYRLPGGNMYDDEVMKAYLAGKRDQLVVDENIYLKSVMDGQDNMETKDADKNGDKQKESNLEELYFEIIRNL